jgi:RimJ/RimL family protein N-acetyltransferase
MISVHRLVDLSSILDLKAQYLQSLVAPLDGMWETGFINPSPHRELRWDDERAGYYACNEEGTLLQFFVRSNFAHDARVLFDHVIDHDSLTQAVVGTIDPLYLSLCLDAQESVRVHTYLYELDSEVPATHPQADRVQLRLIEGAELDRTVSFQQACIGAAADQRGWLRDYSANLIQRGELFILSRHGEWLGAGECRRSDSQQGVADLGMLVAPEHRGNGWATYILVCLSDLCRQQGLRAICSTRVENVGAQRAISRAGFISRHCIMDVTF